ncbi:shikimate kinase [Dysgonomonas sp. 520]|uniref:shikimate kinase n=1 Tax=Dysgonomonas sp. 520 TaxID=2302931 RepID=UPI0013D43A38|nr:shikimate kinase [Dysgonomonas sp. 520]NDW09806.1 shikimate kinase [Dysgonomonas sp. 520]
MERIFLIGYMGVGKTTLGKGLAKALNLEFVDLDLYIQARYQKTVTQLFEEYGEDGFRKIENKLLKEVSDFENVVISTGGGAPCFYDNIDIMNRKGKTVYLKASTDLLHSRLLTCRDKRPLLQNKTDEELYNFIKENLRKREPFYSKAKYTLEAEELVSRDDIEKYVSLLSELLNIKH